MLAANPTPQPPAPEREARLRSLLAEARPRPWEWIAIDSKTLCLGTEGDADMGGHVLWTHSRCDACEKRDAPCMWPSRENSALIAEAVNVLEEHLDTIAALRRDNARLLDRLKSLRPCPDGGRAELALRPAAESAQEVE